MSHRTRKSICIQRFLNKLLPEQAVRKMKIPRDKKTSFILTRDLESQNCTKHINVIYHQIQGLVEDGEPRIQ